MEFRLSGPVQMWAAGRPTTVGTPRQRSVIAALAVDAGRLVRVETIVDRVWGDAPPDQVHSTLYVYISRIRRAIRQATEADSTTVLLRRSSGGYVLEVDPDRIDLHRFRRLVAQAHDERRPDIDRAMLLRQALTLWQGTPLADLSGEWVTRFRAGWQQERIDAAIRWAQAELRLGNAPTVIGPLTDLLAEHPLVETVVAVLMRALHLAGRDTDALSWYTATRQRLVDHLGIDAGAELRELHQAILRGDRDRIRVAAASSATRSPLACTLPADLARFTGRSKQVRDITETVAGAATAGRVVAVHVIIGMPGIGKTALAVRVGHLVADRYPDRQLFIDLHAHTAGHQPTDPADALGVLLAADGLDPRYLPDALDERAALWRDRMADKRALLIFDNAAGSAQVGPLLPAAAGCLVLVTSRRHLGDIPATVEAVPLDVLLPDEATQMFIRMAPRATGEPAKVGELVGLCGHLPLAISLLARLFNKHHTWTMDNLLTETAAKLLTVAAEELTIAAAFELSYDHLTAGQQRVFRHLGLHPGVDIDPYATAALTGLAYDEATDHLDALHSNHLLIETTFRRYRMHDLVREYARALAAGDRADEPGPAVERLLDYYQHAAASCNTQLSRHTRTAATTPAAAPDAAGLHRTQAWMSAERANLHACIDYAATHDRYARVVGLTASIAGHLRTEGSWNQAIDLHTAAADAARHLGDQAGRASALHDLGDVRYLAGDYPGATTVLQEALSIYHDLGNPLGEANVLHELGVVRWLIGDHPGASTLLQQALALHRDIGDRPGEANGLHNLGVVRWLTGDYPGATAALRQALTIYHDVGNRRGQASTLIELGAVRSLTGDYAGATTAVRQALTIYHDVGDRRGQANALNELGAVRWLTGDYPGATTLLRQALDLHSDIGNRLGQANVLKDLGDVRRLTGDYPGANTMLRQALDVFRDIGDQDNEADTLNRIGSLHLTGGHPQQANASHQHALRIAQAIHSQLEEARALEGIGRSVQATTDTDTATGYLQQALTIYRRIGAADAARLAAELNRLDGSRSWPG